MFKGLKEGKATDMFRSVASGLGGAFYNNSNKSEEFKKSVEYYSTIFDKIGKLNFPNSLGNEPIQTLSMLFASNPQLAQSFGFNSSVKEQQEQLNYIGGEADSKLINLFFNTLNNSNIKITKLEATKLAKAILAITKYKQSTKTTTVIRKPKPVITQLTLNNKVKTIIKQLNELSYIFVNDGTNKAHYLIGKCCGNGNQLENAIKIETQSIVDLIKQYIDILLNNKNIAKNTYGLTDQEKTRTVPFSKFNQDDLSKIITNSIKSLNLTEVRISRWKLLANIK